MSKEIIILYVMDALRPDHLGCYGYKRATSKNIDMLAEKGLIFENIYAQSTETKSSAATIFTSTYPSVHETISHYTQLPAGLVTLSESLKSSGFETAAFNTNFRLSAYYGFNRGFDSYFDLHKREEYDDITNLPSSESLNTQVLTWLDGIDANKIFMLLWSMDTHIPYAPPKEFASRFIPDIIDVPDGTAEAIFRAKRANDYQTLIDLYDAEIAYNDHNIGQLIHSLKNRGIWDHTTFILTSDHGEMFLEHGHFMIHGGSPYREVTHVPLVIKSPGLISSRHKKLGGLIDLMPTVLQMTGALIPEKIQGYNLLEDHNPPVILSESNQESGGQSIAVLKSDWKLICTTGFFHNLLMKWRYRSQADRKNYDEMKNIKSELVNKGIPPLLIKKALFRRYLSDFIGIPPAYKRPYNIFKWIGMMFKHFFGSERSELYKIGNDPFEKKNLAFLELSKVKEINDIMKDFKFNNKRFKESLAIKHEEISPNDDLLQERLKQLGYIE